jgi:hypothetical protein
MPAGTSSIIPTTIPFMGLRCRSPANASPEAAAALVADLFDEHSSIGPLLDTPVDIAIRDPKPRQDGRVPASYVLSSICP